MRHNPLIVDPKDIQRQATLNPTQPGNPNFSSTPAPSNAPRTETSTSYENGVKTTTTTTKSGHTIVTKTSKVIDTNRCNLDEALKQIGTSQEELKKMQENTGTSIVDEDGNITVTATITDTDKSTKTTKNDLLITAIIILFGMTFLFAVIAIIFFN